MLYYFFDIQYYKLEYVIKCLSVIMWILKKEKKKKKY